MVAFVDDHRKDQGVEPTCRELQITPSNYYEYKAKQTDDTRQTLRHKSNAALRVELTRLWSDKFMVYGARKVWRQLKSEGFLVARCTREHLMREMSLHGIIKGKAKHATVASDCDERPLNLVHRAFHTERLNEPWLADFTYVTTSSGFIYVALIFDVSSQIIVGWRVARSKNAILTLDALEQSLWARTIKGSLIHHSDRGSQDLSIRYSERLVQAGISTSLGNIGDGYDNALAETINGLFTAEVIWRGGPWRGLEPLSMQPSNGSIGSTTGVSLSQSALFLPWNSKRRIMLDRRSWPQEPGTP